MAHGQTGNGMQTIKCKDAPVDLATESSCSMRFSRLRLLTRRSRHGSNLVICVCGLA